MLGFEPRAVRDDHTLDAGIVVGPFETVDQGTTLQSNSVAIGFNGFMRNDASNWHRQVQFDCVTFCPWAFNLGESLLHLQRNLAPVDFQSRFLVRRFLESIEVTRHRFVSSPTRNTKADGKRLGFLRLDRDSDRSLQGNRFPESVRSYCLGLDRSLTAGEQIDVDVVVFVRIRHSWDRGDKPCHIRRAARTAEPRLLSC